MSEIDRMISANVQVKKGADHPEYLGLYCFFSLPRIGEIVHLTADEQERTLKVFAVDYWGYSENEKVFNVGDTLITCEECK